MRLDEKDNAMRGQFNIIEDWGKKWAEEAKDAKQESRSSNSLSLKVENGTMVEKRANHESVYKLRR